MNITLLWGGCGKITRQLGNIENNTTLFYIIIYVSKCNFFMRELGCVIFGMTPRKKQKKTARDKGFQGWNDVAVWRDFKPIYIPEDIWPHYLEHVMSERFTRRSQSGAGNRNRAIHGSVTTHTGGSVPFSAHAKRMVRLMKYIVQLICC